VLGLCFFVSVNSMEILILIIMYVDVCTPGVYVRKGRVKCSVRKA